MTLRADHVAGAAFIAFEGRNLIVAAVYSLGISLVTYALFTIVLKSPLEQGILGF